MSIFLYGTTIIFSMTVSLIAFSTVSFCEIGFPFLSKPSEVIRIFALQSCSRIFSDSELYPEKITV